MTAVALEEKYPEQGERTKDIGLKRRQLHLLNISEHHLNFTKKTLQNIYRKSFSWKTSGSVLQGVDILEVDVTDEI